MRARLPSYAQSAVDSHALPGFWPPRPRMRARLPTRTPSAVDSHALPGFWPSRPRMRSLVPGARGIGTGWDAILRADGKCARVCPWWRRLSGCRAARGAAGVRAGIRVRPGSSRMRARLPGARGLGAGWGAIVRADGKCARVCPRIRSPQSRGLPAPRVQAAPAPRECACVCQVRGK